MELEKLRVFVALAREGGFSAAGRKLFKSHSSVSRTLTALERELGVTLAVRDRSSFTLTPQGEALLRGAETLLVEADALAETVRKTSAKG